MTSPVDATLGGMSTVRGWIGLVVVVFGCGGDGDSRNTVTTALTIAPGTESSTSGSTGSTGDATTSTTTSTATTDGGTTATADGSTTDQPPVAMCPPMGAQDCTPGPGRESCAKIESCFAGQIATAVSATIMENPTWFEEIPEGTMVLDVDSFVNTVRDKMVDAGRCAIRDPNDALGYEVGVKHNNELAESFRLVTSGGLARKGTGSYTATCTPAWF